MTNPPMRTIKLRKRYNDLAEVRSYVFDQIKADKEGIIFVFSGETMTVPYEELDRGFVTARNVQSRINPEQTFDLISFKWTGDREKENQQ